MDFSDAEKLKPAGSGTTENTGGDGPQVLHHSDTFNDESSATIRISPDEATSFVTKDKPTPKRGCKCNGRRCAKGCQSCFCAPFRNCGNTSHGFLKGARKSLPRKKHLIHHFRRTIGRRIDKNKNAVVIDESPELNISYKVLDEMSNSLAHFLRDTMFSSKFPNLNPEGYLCIAICLPMCYEYVVLLLTILKLGAAILPINPSLPAERIAEILKLSRPILIVAGDDLDTTFDEVLQLVKANLLRVGDLWEVLYTEGWLEKSTHTFKNPIQSSDTNVTYPALWKRPVVMAVIPSDNQDLQTVVYDSNAYVNRSRWENYHFVFITSEYCLIPPGFDTTDTLADVIAYLLIGVTLVVIRTPLDYWVPDTLFMYCEKYKVRRISLWPALLKACFITLTLFDEFIPMVSNIRFWFCTGACVRTDLASMFFELTIHPLAQLINMYHYEDCLGAVTFQIYESLGSSSVQGFHVRLPVGTPVHNCDIYLLDEDMKPVKDGERGEIYICGSQCPMASPIRSNNYVVKNPFSRRKCRSVLIRTSDFGRIRTKTDGTRILYHETNKNKHYYVDNQDVWLDNLDTYLDRLKTLLVTGYTICYRPDEDEQTLVSFCIFTNPKVTPLQVEDELKLCLPSMAIPEVVQISQMPTIGGKEDGPVDERQLLRNYEERRSKRHLYDQWNTLGIKDPFVLHATKVLCHIIYMIMGTPVKDTIATWWTQPFLNMNRASVTKATFILRELHKNRYPLYNDEFVYSESLKVIPDLMVEARRSRGFCNRNCPPDEVFFIKNRYKLAIMVKANRIAVCSLMGHCFIQRDQLDYYAKVEYGNMRRFFDAMWPMFVDKKLSLVIRRKKVGEQIVGAVLNMSWHDEIVLTKTVIPKEVAYKLELIRSLEMSLNDSHFPQDRTTVLQVCYIGLDANTLTRPEMHGLTDKIIRSMLIIGKVKGFEALVVITYDFYQLDICVHNYNFNVAKEVQVNQFVASDGTRPYALCPDTTQATLCWKPLGKSLGLDTDKKR